MKTNLPELVVIPKIPLNYNCLNIILQRAKFDHRVPLRFPLNLITGFPFGSPLAVAITGQPFGLEKYFYCRYFKLKIGV